MDNPRRPGEVAWRDPYRHTTENVGDRTAVEIQIDLKQILCVLGRDRQRINK
jgi:hypothetical protein